MLMLFKFLEISYVPLSCINNFSDQNVGKIKIPKMTKQHIKRLVPLQTINLCNFDL